MRILTADHVRRVFTMRHAFDAVETAAVIHTLGKAEAPARHQVTTAHPKGEMLVMPGVVDGSLFGVKLWYRFETPPERMPQSSACILLLDPVNGEEILLDGEVITDLRTGALTGVAAVRLADPAATEVGLVGAGTQARTQILALVEAMPNVRRIRVFARNRHRLAAFVEAMRSEVDRTELAIDSVHSAEEACMGADVLVAATTSSEVVIHDAWVKDGALVCGVGSHDPASSELDPATVARAEVVVVDTARGGIDGAGDISGPINSGALDRSQVLELGDLVSGARGWSRTSAGVAVFKSVGFAATDVVAASMVAERASRSDVGIKIDLHATSGP